MRFIFVRHGSTEWNEQKRYQGLADIPLSDLGRAQGEALEKRFKNIDVDIIYSSPLKRAYQTAEYIGKAKGMDVNALDAFKEIDYGEWDGKTMEELTAEYGEAFTKYRTEPFYYPIPGEGTLSRAAIRVASAIEDIKEAYRDTDKTVVVVSHGGILKLAIFHLLDMSPRYYRCIVLDNTSISTVTVGKERCILKTLNDTGHLAGIKSRQYINKTKGA